MATLKATTVTVRPTGTTAPDVECDISGPDVTDDAVFLNNVDTYDITFLLRGGGGANPSQFDPANPFANRNAKCPGGKATPQPPCVVTVPPAAPAYDSFTVQVSPTGNRGVSHYRLNFPGGLSCDPIIIHE